MKHMVLSRVGSETGFHDLVTAVWLLAVMEGWFGELRPTQYADKLEERACLKSR